MGKRENQKIVMDGFKSEPPMSDDDILAKLYEQGVAFSDLRPTFNEIVKEKGLRLTNKERKIKTAELLDGVEGFEDAETMLKTVSMLQDKLKVATTKAMGSLRTWAKDNGIVLPKVKKESKARRVGFGGHYEKILAHVMELRADKKDIDKKAIVAFCHDNSIPEAYSTVALNVVHFAKIWSGEIEEVVEEAAA